MAFTTKSDVINSEPETITFDGRVYKREVVFTFKNYLDSSITLTIDCSGSPVITYAMLGDNDSKVELVDFSCGSSLTAKAKQVGGVSIISNDGYSIVTLSVKMGGLSTLVIILIVAGGLALVALGVGLFFCLKKQSAAKN